MAESLLMKLLEREISSKSLIYWLKGHVIDDQNDENFIGEFDLTRLNKTEFVPFFLNFLRDQASIVLPDNKSSACSPLKAPASVFPKPDGKLLSTPQFNSSFTKSDNSSSHRAAPFETPPSDGYSRRLKLHSTPGSSETGRGLQNNSKKDFRVPSCSLGDFLGPGNNGRYGRRTRNDEISPLNGARKSFGRSKCFNDAAKIQPKIEEQIESPPVFDLTSANDFPDVKKLKETPNPKTETRSRRIVPMQVGCVGPSVEQSSSFAKVTDVPAPAKVMPRSIWAKPPENIAAFAAPSGDSELNELMKRLQVPGKSAGNKSSQKKDKVKLSESSGKITKTDSDEPGLTSSASETKSISVPPHSVCVLADPSEVTDVERLKVLAEFYSQCIAEGLVSNVSMEFYFIIGLLTVRRIQSTNNEIDFGVRYFSSVHNAVFFATTSLLHLKSFLSVFDRPTVRLLAENVRVSCFSMELKEILVGISEQPTASIHSSVGTSPLGGVIFQPETDNRQNFPSDRSFHSFKKQRDVFYDLLRDWEAKHLMIGWSMRGSQVQPIRWLMDECLKDLANYVHLVRLFVLQLIKMCGAEGNLKAEEKEAQLQLELLEANRDKLKRLQERLTNPSSTGGISPSPSFPGCQEFFRDFITIASDHSFCRHLSDVLVAKINKLTENSETNEHCELSAHEKHEELLQNLLMLRILGKFLGFVTFLPYRSVERPLDPVRNLLIKTRNESPQPIDVISHLRILRQKEKLLPCVVWVVDFLSQMDFVAPDLKYFREVYGCLIDIYCGCFRAMRDHHAHGNRCTHGDRLMHALFLIAALLGWLFELRLFPEDMFYALKSSDISNRESIWTAPDSPESFLIVDQRILYSCCPFLAELRSLLLDFTTDISQSANAAARKITPIKSIDFVPANETKDIQKQLEDNFFNLHSSSLLQTVVFASGRVASNFVKTFQSSVLSENLKRCQIEAKLEARSLASSSLAADSKATVDAIDRIDDHVRRIVRSVLENAIELSRNYCKDKVDSLMANLLPEEMAAAVKTIACRKCSNRAVGKIDAWLRENVTVEVFMKDVRSTFNHEMSQASALGVNGLPATLESSSDLHKAPHFASENSASGPDVSDVLTNLKQVLRDLLMRRKSLDSHRLQSAVESIAEIIHHQPDLLSINIVLHLELLSVNLAAYTVFFRPDLWTKSVEDQLVGVWEWQRCGRTLDQIACNKFITCFKNSSQESQKKFTDLLKRLLELSLVKAQTVSIFTDLSQD